MKQAKQAPHMWHHLARNTSNLFCHILLKRLKRRLQKHRRVPMALMGIIKEQQKDFLWINQDMVNYFIKVSHLQQGKQIY